MRYWLKYLLLLCVLIFSAGPALAQYVTIGTGTANNLYTTRLFTTFYEDSKAEMDFLSTELNGASNPLVLGDTIYSIGWYVIATNSDKQVMYNANIKFTEGTNTVTVWSGNLAPNDDEWNDILLNHDFELKDKNEVAKDIINKIIKLS
ncbi:MAG: hypothetical protein HN535_05710 [Flavobacteriales bacterium]|nr:hypothetical protein [Flavobacteriales bacterium]